MKTNFLLVIGGSTVKQTEKGFFTKNSFYRYLLDLKKSYTNVVWIVPTNHLNEVKQKIDTNLIKILNYNQSVLGSINLTLRLIKFLAKNNSISCLMFPSPYIFYNAFFIRFFCKKFVCYLGIDFTLFPNNQFFNLKTFILKKTYEIPLYLSNSIIVRGNRLKEISQLFSKKVILSPPISNLGDFRNFYNLKISKLNKNSGSLSILYVGKLIRDKGVLDLFEAYKIIKKKLPNIKLKIHIVGDGRLLNLLKEIADENFYFHGWIDDMKKMKDLFLSADVLTFLSTQNYPEGLPRVIEEAHSYGVPVCASKLSSIKKDFSNKNIKFFLSSNPTSLSNSIIEVYMDSKLRQKLILNGFKRLNNLYLNDASLCHIKVLEDLS